MTYHDHIFRTSGGAQGGDEMKHSYEETDTEGIFLVTGPERPNGQLVAGEGHAQNLTIKLDGGLAVKPHQGSAQFDLDLTANWLPPQKDE